MTPLQRRFALFLGGCIPSRLALTASAKYISPHYLPYVALITLPIAIGFLYLYFTGTRRTGLETGGTPIWWMKYRIIHGLSYLIFSIMALMRVKQAYVVLLVDTLFGLALFIIHHYSEGDFRQLFHHS
jgi:hypothetical protein